MLPISIPQPCHEDWNAMTPTGKGVYCTVCTKEVMDFSQMSDDEVRNYFLLNAGKKTCGRFRNDQLRDLDIIVDEAVIYSRIPLWKKMLAILVICFGVLAVSCTQHKAPEPVTKTNQVAAAATAPVKQAIPDTFLKWDVKSLMMKLNFRTVKIGPSFSFGFTTSVYDYLPEDSLPKSTTDSLLAEKAVYDTLPIPAKTAAATPDTLEKKAVDSCTLPVYY